MRLPSVPPKAMSAKRSGWGIIPKTFPCPLIIPAMLFAEPLGLVVGLGLPLKSQYLKIIRSVSSRAFKVLLSA